MLNGSHVMQSVVPKKTDGAGARRGRPPNVRRRREIARQAIAAFAEHGYDGCSMSHLAARCGVGRTLLLRYFARKDLVLAAAAEYARERIVAAAEALRLAAARTASLREFLLLAGTIQVHHVDELAAWYAAWLGGLPLAPGQRGALDDAQESLYATVAGCARRHGAAGDPYVLARTQMGALQSLVLTQNRTGFEPAGADLRTLFVEEMVELVLRGAQRAAR